MTLGSDEAVQRLALARTDTKFDSQSEQAREDATSICLSFLNIELEPASPSTQLSSAVNLIAAAFMTRDKDKADQFSNEGHKLLEQLKGDIPDESDWGISFTVERQ